MSPVNVSSIGAYIREQREQAKISLRQLAESAGVSNPYLSQIERGLRRPSADILQQIAKGLRISAEALYVQAGFLEDRPPGSAVRDAVLTDAELTERQKQMLIEIYESFRKETAMASSQVAELVDDQTGIAPDEAAENWPEEPIGAAARRRLRAIAGAGDDDADISDAGETDEVVSSARQEGSGAGPWHIPESEDSGPQPPKSEDSGPQPPKSEGPGPETDVHRFPVPPGSGSVTP